MKRFLLMLTRGLLYNKIVVIVGIIREFIFEEGFFEIKTLRL